MTTEVWMFSVALVLAILTVLHLITAWPLLFLTLALSIGDALEAPSWQSPLSGRFDISGRFLVFPRSTNHRPA
jgi:transmembrane secretion effector